MMIFANVMFNSEKHNSPVAFLFMDKETLQAAQDSCFVKSVDDILPLRVSGRTYQERKDSLRDLAIEYQYADNGGLSWGDYSLICDFFRTNGKRYGLLREFSENGIC